ncbi:Coq4 family protein [Pendulispora brunnea]|uniref:Coq4 family protein n=1 Tax=Pendulispora brunnea TaxID=2905690 RepID=A0ABZ2K926_9BACT
MATIKGVRAFVTVVRDTSSLEPIFQLRESLTNPKMLTPMIADLKERSAEARTAFRTLRRLPPWNFASLDALPEGSLGRHFAEHVRAAGIDPAALPTLPAHDDFGYVAAHLYETHDLWHALTGFDIDVAGELGLQAFYLAQQRSGLSLAILSAGMLNTAIYAMDDRVRRLDAISVGWGMGRYAKPIFGIDWESLLPQSLEEVRARYRIVPVTQAFNQVKLAA